MKKPLLCLLVVTVGLFCVSSADAHWVKEIYGVFRHEDHSVNRGPDYYTDQLGLGMKITYSPTETLDFKGKAEFLDNLYNGNHPTSGNVGVGVEWRPTSIAFVAADIEYRGASVASSQELVTEVRAGIRF